ncbi:lactosylceramide 4-alpha-galactosyltransferase isoform X2 [Cephus cinctus]|uniref:Lactosylceramide 4-alpha-galactosyltransferase isoform X2 n=1 Tax=Cephus cinctus TaxID=211228 RepID=A0AAJ7FLK0_CEPCN|nr:lactosylceramide 4-alpha-galactosyltransferase isoform X2 [Cephus cinctus]
MKNYKEARRFVNVRMKKSLLIAIAIGTLLFVMVVSNDDLRRIVPFMSQVEAPDISCYDVTKIYTKHVELPDFETPTSDRNIFFHETSCFNDDQGLLKVRQACAVESAALMNPSTIVYLLFVSWSKFTNTSRNFVQQLSTYDNIKIRHIVIDDYLRNTPLAEWYASGVLKRSQWPKSHISDILRYLTLWKYGGIYLDLDVVVTSSLENLLNFAGAEDREDVAAGVIGFSPTGLGHKLADECLRDLQSNFRGDVWGHNGPGVITRTLKKLCGTRYTKDMTSRKCHGFKVFPPSAFYPIHYKKWRKYFETKDANATMKILQKAKAIHVWNKLSESRSIKVGSKVPYAIIAEKYCPKIYRSAGTEF